MKRILGLTSLMVPLACGAAEIDYTMSAEGSYVHIDNKDNEGEENSLDTFSFTPRASLLFSSRRLRVEASGSNRFVDRHLSTNRVLNTPDDSRNSFPFYSVNATANVIEDVLTVSGNTGQFYSNSGVTSSLITDEVFRSNSLSRTKRSGADFALTIPNPRYFNLAFFGGINKFEADESLDNDRRVDTTNRSLRGVFTQGNELTNVSWNILATRTDTEGRFDNDVNSRNYRGSFYVSMFDDFRFVATGNSENNELIARDNQTENNSRTLEFTSYGAGLSWYKSESRFIDLTYNISDEQNGEREKFVGLNFNWRFSARTQVSGEYGRRFFGESGSFRLSHNLRKLRSSVSYTESLTTYSRLQLGDAFTSVFVCPVGAGSDFSACFQPDSLDYELQVGEEFTPLTFATVEISEEPILRKSLAASIGYSARKLQSELRISNADIDYLDTNRQQDALYVTLSLALDLNRRTSVRFTNSVSDISTFGESGEGVGEKTFLSTLGYNYRLSDKLVATAEYRYENQDSPVPSRDFVTNRFTLSFSYTFR